MKEDKNKKSSSKRSCVAFTRGRTQCSREAIDGSEYCKQHKKINEHKNKALKKPQLESSRVKSSISSIIPILSFIIALIVLFFGNDIYNRYFNKVEIDQYEKAKPYVLIVVNTPIRNSHWESVGLAKRREEYPYSGKTVTSPKGEKYFEIFLNKKSSKKALIWSEESELIGLDTLSSNITTQNNVVINNEENNSVSDKMNKSNSVVLNKSNETKSKSKVKAYAQNLEFKRIPANKYFIGLKKSEKQILKSKFSRLSYDWLKYDIQFDSVDITSFEISKHEISVGQYKMFLDSSKYKVKPPNWDTQIERGLNFPITNITWVDARAFCRWLSNETGENFNLPTDNQWEIVAHGKTRSLYITGNNVPTSNEVWYSKHSSLEVDESLQDVSDFNTLNMIGNVSEWCLDDCGNGKSVRGSNYSRIGNQLHISFRDCIPMNTSRENTGFRIVKN